ncbi:Hypothetical protein CINCED_3A019886 [Cinara cedri]|uniref:Uncharacterized protein n=1 Tax=Cinara cedri TaxID=506608 RepID=A0A5E4LZJ2_9HEMI|nr:Hypothetical protein CINCED_3A019886 [Cinara cedri]
MESINVDVEDIPHVGEHFEDADSDSSDMSTSDSIISSFLIGDPKATQEWTEFVNDIKKQYFVYGIKHDDEEDVEPETIYDEDVKDCGGDDTISTHCIDAINAAERNLSEVKLLWTHALCQYTFNKTTATESYTTTTSIEKVILLYAKNFIEQFKMKYPNRKQLTLILRNECGIQKCICTMIKPSRLVYCELNDYTSYSEFVAKHIEYINLEEPTTVPNKLFSPTVTLETQTANCFELATLLVSFLLGCQYNAFVVQGYASEYVSKNDLRKVKLDIPTNYKFKNNEDNSLDDTYVVEPPVFELSSKFATYLIDESNKTVQNEVKEEVLSDLSDPLYGKRVHCWVIVMPLELKDEDMIKNSYFIEPSTGEREDISNKNYIGIESIWNHTNYWVNLQPLNGGCMQYNFNLMNTSYWLNFLQNKPTSVPKLISNDDKVPRNIIMPNSWVNMLQVPRDKYLMLYPNGKKIVLYMNAIKEYFAGFIRPDGLIEKTTYYTKSDYMKKLFVNKIYKHRTDNLIAIEKNYTSKGIETIEYFESGRKDCLKVHKFCGESSDIETKRLITFYNVRLDSIVSLKIDENYFIALFKDRSDLLFWRMCEFYYSDDSRTFNVKRKPMRIKEKYLRDESKHKDHDIATRNFDLIVNEIYVIYQYGEGQITQSSRLFNKPSRTSSDQFDPTSVIEDLVWPYEKFMKPHEKYLQLQDLIKAENDAIHDISTLEDDVIKILEVRDHERLELKLKIDLLDWDQNHKMRQLIQNKKDKRLRLAKRGKAKQIDYVSPYFETNKPPYTYSESLHVRNKVLRDYRQNAKNQFLRTKKLFKQKQFVLQSMIKELNKNEFKDSETKKKLLTSCSIHNVELTKLMLKMKRLKADYANRYNDLALSLNKNMIFSMLKPLKLFDL